MSSDFLESRGGRPWSYDRSDADFEFYQGEGTSSLEIAVVDLGERPTKDFLQRTYSDRRGGRVNPILVVALYDDKVGLCGPSGEDPPVFRDVDRGQAERVCDAALKKPDRHVAQSFLTNTLPQLDEELAGLRNQGLLSTHELRVGVPERDDWEEASERAQQALTDDPRELVEGLNYEVDRLTDQSYVLKDTSDGHERAVAMFLQEDESFDHKQDRFVNKSPVAYALNEADKRNLDYVIGSSGDTLRLYTTNPEAGFGSRGRTDTYVEVNTNLLADEKAAYLWLLFSSNALRDDGALHQIMEDSKEYAADLGGRLRNRIYDDVIPDLAEAIAEARDIEDPTKEELDQTYEMALFLLYRLLFIAYAEDEEFLPRRRNGRYDQHSLKQKAHDLHELVQEGGEFDNSFYDHWDDVMRLSRAIHHGHDELGLPAYEGRILSEDEDVSEAGARLGDIRLNNADFGPVLFRLLVDENEDGYQGPVDFRNIGVREFGVIYEGLLESELSIAEQPLTTDEDGHYQPIDSEGQQTLGEDEEDVVVEEGEVYLHGQSGERKATGTYYTKTRFVEHLLEHSLEPALDDHIDRIDRLREDEGENAAAEAFFDIRVSDISMGSGHFLVGAVDRIETRLRAYLTENQLTPVEKELDNLRDAAEGAFEDDEYTPNIEQGQLLRRQVARRCIYGVDLNPLSTELARLSIWVHTFVPGLPLTFLDYNLVSGDSLAGIGTLGEVKDILDIDQSSLGMFTGGQSVMKEIRTDISRLGNFADASAEQVQEARETRAKIEQKLEEVKGRFDVLAASRINDDIDIDPVSDTEIDITEKECYDQAQKVLRSTNPLHFPAAFPEVFDDSDPGFDVIVGNPPWEQTKIERDEFWRRHYPGLSGLDKDKREEKISNLEQKRPDLKSQLEQEREAQQQRSQILINGPYPDMGRGDPDLYQGFSWRFWRLISEGGFIGVVLPRAAFISPGAETLRYEILESGNIHDLTFLKNEKEWVFDNVEPRYTIALFALQMRQLLESEVPIRGPYTDPESYEKGVSKGPTHFPVEEAKNWAGSAKFPLLPPAQYAPQAFKQLTTSSVLSAENNEWRALPYREDVAHNEPSGDDVETNPDEVPDHFWPVFKGASINPPNSELWVNDTGKRYAWVDPTEGKKHLQQKRENAYPYSNSPMSEMPEDWVMDKETLPCLHPRVSLRKVARSDDQRTLRPALIPPEVFLNNTVIYFLWPEGDKKDEAYLLGVLNSLFADWYARRFVETHLTFQVIKTFPIPRTGQDDPLRKRVIELSGRLAAIDDRYDNWADRVNVEYGPLNEDEKRDKIYELDAVVAHLYGLTREHVEVIFETFHDGWDYEERLERVLDYYASWADRLDLDHADREAEQAAGTRNDD